MIRSRAGESLFRSQGVQENYICAVVIEAAITPNPTKGLRSTYLLVRTCKSGSKSHGHAKARDQLLGPGGAFTRSDLGNIGTDTWCNTGTPWEVVLRRNQRIERPVSDKA